MCASSAWLGPNATVTLTLTLTVTLTLTLTLTQSTDAANRGWVAVFAPLAAYAVLGFGAYAAGITAGLAGAWYALQALAQTLLGGGATP